MLFGDTVRFTRPLFAKSTAPFKIAIQPFRVTFPLIGSTGESPRIRPAIQLGGEEPIRASRQNCPVSAQSPSARPPSRDAQSTAMPVRLVHRHHHRQKEQRRNELRSAENSFVQQRRKPRGRFRRNIFPFRKFGKRLDVFFSKNLMVQAEISGRERGELRFRILKSEPQSTVNAFSFASSPRSFANREATAHTDAESIPPLRYIAVAMRGSRSCTACCNTSR